jgi:hypothetical protein
MEKMICNHREFQVLKLLGKGKGGYSWLVTDGKAQYVLKQIHHEPCSYYTFGDKLGSELRDYEILKKLGIPLPELLDVDYARERILKTFIDGDTVNVLVRENRMEPVFYHQIQAICEKLYAANLNIDYYPTNFVVQAGVLYYIDFECNGYMDQWNYENWGCKYWYKTPEFEEAFQ